jgi:hypothetical protein
MTDMGDDTAPDTGESEESDVLVTIARDPAGGYLVYAGDEPEEDEGGAEDEGAEGNGEAGAGAGAGMASGGGAEAGQHADSVGAALKAAMDILQESENSAGAPGSSEDQFAAGFAGGAAPAPAAGPTRMKHPPGLAA